MRITLVANIKYQAILIGMEDSMDGHDQFHRTQAGSQMPASTGYCINQSGPQQLAQSGRFTVAQTAQVIGNMV